MVLLANEVISNPSHQQTQDHFAQSLKELLDSIHATQAALTADGTAVPGNQPLSPTVVSIHCTWSLELPDTCILKTM